MKMIIIKNILFFFNVVLFVGLVFTKFTDFCLQKINLDFFWNKNIKLNYNSSFFSER